MPIINGKVIKNLNSKTVYVSFSDNGDGTQTKTTVTKEIVNLDSQITAAQALVENLQTQKTAAISQLTEAPAMQVTQKGL